jgi:uncharacterized membrane protein
VGPPWYIATVPRVLVPAALAAVALAGLGVAAYLTTVHYAHVPLVCSTTGLVDCDDVLHSSYSVIPGTQVPITVPGMFWFLISGIMAVLAIRSGGPVWVPAAHALWTVLGILTVIYLVAAELIGLHHICAWCTAVHVLIVISFVLAMVRWQRAALANL